MHLARINIQNRTIFFSGRHSSFRGLKIILHPAKESHSVRRSHGANSAAQAREVRHATRLDHWPRSPVVSPSDFESNRTLHRGVSMWSAFGAVRSRRTLWHSARWRDSLHLRVYTGGSSYYVVRTGADVRLIATALRHQCCEGVTWQPSKLMYALPWTSVDWPCMQQPPCGNACGIALAPEVEHDAGSWRHRINDTNLSVFRTGKHASMNRRYIAVGRPLCAAISYASARALPSPPPPMSWMTWADLRGVSWRRFVYSFDRITHALNKPLCHSCWLTSDKCDRATTIEIGKSSIGNRSLASVCLLLSCANAATLSAVLYGRLRFPYGNMRLSGTRRTKNPSTDRCEILHFRLFNAATIWLRLI